MERKAKYFKTGRKREREEFSNLWVARNIYCNLVTLIYCYRDQFFKENFR